MLLIMSVVSAVSVIGMHCQAQHDVCSVAVDCGMFKQETCKSIWTFTSMNKYDSLCVAYGPIWQCLCSLRPDILSSSSFFKVPSISPLVLVISLVWRCMNEYGALVEWYWQGKTEVLGAKHYTALVVDVWMSKEHWWNDTNKN
jgi:hypothetical protein